jgi:hypothetical protein
MHGKMLLCTTLDAMPVVPTFWRQWWEESSWFYMSDGTLAIASGEMIVMAARQGNGTFT